MLYQFKESEQTIFLDQQSCFRSPKYTWFNCVMHNWSRVWVYTFTYYQLSVIILFLPNTTVLSIYPICSIQKEDRFLLLLERNSAGAISCGWHEDGSVCFAEMTPSSTFHCQGFTMTRN